MESEAFFGVVLVVFLVAGAVKGVSGMGLPTVAMALLGVFIPPAHAAALMVLPSLATNVAQCLGPHGRGLARRLWPLWLALVACILFSPLPDLVTAGASARGLLGVVLMAYGLWGLLRPAAVRALRRPRTWGVVSGALTGLVAAATGVFVLPLVPYLQALGLSKNEMIQALGLSFTLATLALTIKLGTASTMLWSSGAATLTAVVAAFAGMWIGSRLRGRLGAVAFQRTLFSSFIALGAVAVVRAL